MAKVESIYEILYRNSNYEILYRKYIWGKDFHIQQLLKPDLNIVCKLVVLVKTNITIIAYPFFSTDLNDTQI